MIIIQDIIMLMRHGFSHEDIRFGMPVNELRAKLGEPDSIIGDGQIGYLFYNPLRIGYSENVVDSIVILFDNERDYKFKINLDHLEEGIDIIRKKMRIHELINVFNNNGIMWSAHYRKNELDYVSIIVEKGSEVLFDLETGCICRIGFNPTGGGIFMFKCEVINTSPTSLGLIASIGFFEEGYPHFGMTFRNEKGDRWKIKGMTMGREGTSTYRGVWDCNLEPENHGSSLKKGDILTYDNSLRPLTFHRLIG